ncbi:expressed unknown protein [Seminavis robusta]|uniref:Uncharacterized protein n=1 Tax=Seminavis robusta TaxID=568900 RepID=A0A9N8EHD1_9STRA|nr:expressed unknown protein [Seminavis robusta]|eukprot:Sro939_g222480.1 n/a (400) ;mRNA; f:32540-33739
MMTSLEVKHYGRGEDCYIIVHGSNNNASGREIASKSEIERLLIDLQDTLEYLKLDKLPAAGTLDFARISQCHRLKDVSLNGKHSPAFVDSFLQALSELPCLRRLFMRISVVPDHNNVNNNVRDVRGPPRRRRRPVELPNLARVLTDSPVLETFQLELGGPCRLVNAQEDMYEILIANTTAVTSFSFVDHTTSYNNDSGTSITPDLLARVVQENTTLQQFMTSFNSQRDMSDSEGNNWFAPIADALQHNHSLKRLEMMYGSPYDIQLLESLLATLQTTNTTLQCFQLYSWYDVRNGFVKGVKHETMTLRDALELRRKVRFLTDLNRLGRGRIIQASNNNEPLSLQQWMAAMIVEEQTPSEPPNPYGVYYNHKRLSMTFYLAQQHPFLILPRHLGGMVPLF